MKLNLKQFQDDFLFSQSRFPAIVSGICTGKTYMLLLKIWKFCEDYPNSLAIIARKEYTDLRDCFDDKTEILTNSGFKFFKDLLPTDLALSLNPTTNISEYKNITQIIKQKYTGKMYLYESRSREFCITPNHKLFIASPTSKDKKKAKTSFKFEEARNIKQKSFFLKRDFGWIGEEQNTITFAKFKNGKGRVFRMDDWLEFLGWYVSEGNIYKHKTKKTWWISITQNNSKNPDKVEKIRGLLKRMGLPITLYSNEKFTFGSRVIAEHLKEHCGDSALNKKVPSYVKDLTPRQIEIFLNSYNMGDGYILENETRRFNTISKQLADDIQELILKTSKYASISIRDSIGRTTWLDDHFVTTRHLDYLIIEYSKKHKSYDCLINTSDMQTIGYDGYIYCVTVDPFHTIYVRRNGKCMWSGNSTLKDFERYFNVKADANKEYHFKNSSVIMFRHAAELNVLKNINLSIAGIEQAEEFENDEQFIFLRDRLRRDNAPIQQLCIVANANGHNWIWNKWVNNPSTEYSLSTANTFDNADNLPETFLKDMRQMEIDSPNHYKQFVMNSFEETGADDVLMIARHVYQSSKLVFPYFGSQGRIMAVDVARYGDDETVFTVIEKVSDINFLHVHQETWRNKSLMETTGKILDLKKELKVDLIIIDDTGLGGGVTDRLKELKYRVQPFNGGEKALNPMYFNKRSEGFFLLKEMIDNGRLKIIDDFVLSEQLLSVKFKFKSDGVKAIVSKDEMRKDGLKSPDRADALCMACYYKDAVSRTSIFGQADKLEFVNADTPYDMFKLN